LSGNFENSDLRDRTRRSGVGPEATRPRASSRAGARNRRGFGILFGVIVLFLVTMLTMGLAQHVFSSRVATGTQTGIVGELSISIAQSAAEEAFRSIGLQANDMESPLYRKLRLDLAQPIQAAFAVDIPVPETVREIEETEGYAGFKVEGGVAKAEVLGAGTLAGLTYENMGTMKVTIRVKHKSTGVQRTLHQTRGYKVSMVSTPRPFDQATLFILNPQNLIDSRGAVGANEGIRSCVNTLLDIIQKNRPEIKKYIEATVDRANQEAGKANSEGVTDDNGQPIPPGSPERFTRHLDRAIVPMPPDFSGRVEDDWHYFPEKPGDYVVFSLKPRIEDLSELFLWPEIERKNEEIREWAARYKADADAVIAVCQEVNNAIDQRDQTYKSKRAALERRMEAACQQLRASMTALAGACVNKMFVYQNFMRALSERQGDGASELQAFRSKFDLRSSFGNRPPQVMRSFYSFSGAGAVASLDKLLSRYSSEGRPFNGVVHLDSGGGLIRLEKRSFHGRLALLITGNANLSDLSIDDAEQDMLTIQVDGSASVEGKLTCSLMVKDDLKFTPGAEVQGNVIMFQVYSPDRLQARIVRDPRFRSSKGGRPEEQWAGHFVVAFSPKLASTIVERR
jgi:hypothetical protein